MMALLSSGLFRGEGAFLGLLMVEGLAFLGYGAGVFWGFRRKLGDRLLLAARLVWGLGILLNGAILGLQGVEAGRLPLQTLPETLLGFTFLLGALALVVEWRRQIPVLGGLALLVCLAAVGWALGQGPQDDVALPPALRSLWFLPHVAVYFGGYGCLTVAFILALLGLRTGKLTPEGFWHRVLGSGSADYEVWAFRWLRGSFVLLTAGLVSGSLWASSAWGDYWAWDPKETWGLLSWLACAAVLHGRRIPSFQGRRALAAVLAVWGVALFTYLGMGLLPTRHQSLHVYGASRGSEQP